MSGTTTRKTYERVGAASYLDVASMSEETAETVIPDGETWQIRRFRANAAYTPDVEVALVWDRGEAGEMIIGSTHGDADLPFDLDLVGDGVKVLALVLDNASTGAHTIGGSWEGLKL